MEKRLDIVEGLSGLVRGLNCEIDVGDVLSDVQMVSHTFFFILCLFCMETGHIELFFPQNNYIEMLLKMLINTRFKCLIIKYQQFIYRHSNLTNLTNSQGPPLAITSGIMVIRKSNPGVQHAPQSILPLNHRIISSISITQ